MNIKYHNDKIFSLIVCPDSAVCIATRYGLDGSGIQTPDFPHPSRTVMGPTQPSLQWVTGLFAGSTAPGAWC